MQVWRWGLDLWVAHCCFEHAGQNFGSRPRPPGIRVCALMAMRGRGPGDAGAAGDRRRGVRAGRRAGRRDRRGEGLGHGVHPGSAPVPAGKRRTTVREVAAATGTVLGLAEQLAGEGIEMVTLEATSDYWRIWFYVLEAAGLRVQLVNARDVKNAPGRPKTDKLDAVWLAKLTERGMLRPSFVPPAEIRQLRDYTRLRTDLTRER